MPVKVNIDFERFVIITINSQKMWFYMKYIDLFYKLKNCILNL